MASEAKHTPGPWRWLPGTPHPYEGKLARLVGAGDAPVCDFGDSAQFYPTEGTEPSEADKALIEAAPDLLAALREIEHLYGADACSRREQAYKIARAAIARAEGG